jgi:hypothetical protein
MKASESGRTGEIEERGEQWLGRIELISRFVLVNHEFDRRVRG